jgi:hypothetical protein
MAMLRDNSIRMPVRHDEALDTLAQTNTLVVIKHMVAQQSYCEHWFDYMVGDLPFKTGELAVSD